MTSAKSALIALMLATLGIWGCAKGPSDVADAEHVRSLEARALKVEDDFRAAATARDQLRKKLSLAENEQRKAHEQLDHQVLFLTRERDDLRQQLSQRTSERDALAGQYEQFRKTLHELLGQADAARPKAPTDTPVTAASPTVPGKS